jgi:hypothetical protein
VRKYHKYRTLAPVMGHVSLTFPPARDLNLDFLDSIRTPPPCGMPKGESKEGRTLAEQICRFTVQKFFAEQFFTVGGHQTLKTMSGMYDVLHSALYFENIFGIKTS